MSQMFVILQSKMIYT